ncbi:MAG: diadenylate cyclase CdaA [Chloroflexota bacterium]
MPLLDPILGQIHPNTIVDIGITALLIYWLFKLIRGTRAVSLVIGVSVLVLVYALAIAFDLHLLSQILQAGAVVGLFALVVIFQPELRRALERIGRVGSFGWLLSPAETRAAVHVSNEVARAAAELSAEGQGALIVLQRETGLEEVAETGVMVHGDVSADLLVTIFTPKSPLHDGAVIIREDRIVAAGTLLPLAETSIHTERFGTRHRAALGITEQTDAIVVVVSEENGQISLVERARIVRNLTETGLARAIQGLLDPASAGRGAFAWRSAGQGGLAGRAPRLRELGRLVGRPAQAREPQATAAPAAAPDAATASQPTPTASAIPAGSTPTSASPVSTTTTGTATDADTRLASSAPIAAPAPSRRVGKAKTLPLAANDDNIVASRPARSPR